MTRTLKPILYTKSCDFPCPISLRPERKLHTPPQTFKLKISTRLKNMTTAHQNWLSWIEKLVPGEKYPLHSSVKDIPYFRPKWSKSIFFFYQNWSNVIPFGAAHNNKPLPPGDIQSLKEKIQVSHHKLTRISNAIRDLSLEQLSVSPKTVWSSLSRFIWAELTWSIWRDASSVIANIRFFVDIIPAFKRCCGVLKLTTITDI